MTEVAAPAPADANQKKRGREDEEESGKRRKITYEVPHQPKEEGHFHVVLGLDIDAEARYKIIAYLGDGTFGKVVQAWDRTLRQFCAVKIVRNIPKYTKDAEYEANYMQRIVKDDPEDKASCVRLRETFVNDRGHMCLVMSRHGPNLLKCLQRKTFTMLQVRDIAKRIFTTLDFMHRKMKCVHTDLKPENILLDGDADSIMESSVPIRVCDFGGCSDDNKTEGRISTIQTRHYRAPEVVLKMGWRASADIWSVGCILFELHSGRLLYDTHESKEHLAMMQAHQGPFPSDFPKKVGSEFASWFHRSGKLVWPAVDTTSKSIAAVSKQNSLRDLIPDDDMHDLIRQCMHFEPNMRPTPKEALEHKFCK